MGDFLLHVKKTHFSIPLPFKISMSSGLLLVLVVLNFVVYTLKVWPIIAIVLYVLNISSERRG